MKNAKKTSDTPVCVYKYRLYAPTGTGAELACEAFAGARIHYNKIITIERRRREDYRKMRSSMFPELATLEARQVELDDQLKVLRGEIQAEKSRTRSRVVAPEKQAAVATLAAQKKASLVLLRAARAETRRSVALYVESDLIDGRARRDIAALRPETYFGTYLLVEAAADAARGSKTDPNYNLDPPHRLKSRIGVHFCNGESVAKVMECESTLMRIAPVQFRLGKNDDEKANGKAAQTTLLLRVGSEGKSRKPVWASFPMVMHRPLPHDARIKKAYVTRKRDTVRTPWQYHLCVVLEAPSFHRTLPLPIQEGTTAINFGWRATENGIRVATINREGKTPEEVLLPLQYIGLERKRRDLAEILARDFNEAKSRLVAWLKVNTCPEGFRESFAMLATWSSRYRFAELMNYWQEHRFAGDEEIFARLAARESPEARSGRRSCDPWRQEDVAQASWMVRYRHLQTWLDSVQHKLGNWRDNYYRSLAKKITTTSAVVCVEDFDMRQVARRPKPEEPEDRGDELARSNRQLASVSDLRLKILHAAAKFHCVVGVVPPWNNTRRCDVCGETYPWDPKHAVVHLCTCGAKWDQDVNNTDNQHAHVASGEMVPLVVPAEKHEIPGKKSVVVRAKTTSLRGARKKLGKFAKEGGS